MSDIKIGNIFGEWKVVSDSIFKKYKKNFYLCECTCGKIKPVCSGDLKSGKSQRCEECRKKRMKTKPPAYKDGGRFNRLKKCWHDLHSRCYNKKDSAYSRYGGNNIFVDSEWFIFENFQKWALMNGYKDNLTLDRKNNNLGYSPKNCKWSTYIEQARNRKNNKYYFAFGENKIMSEWLEDKRCLVSESTLNNRLKRGWNPEHALTFPLNPALSYKQMKEKYL